MGPEYRFLGEHQLFQASASHVYDVEPKYPDSEIRPPVNASMLPSSENESSRGTRLPSGVRWIVSPDSASTTNMPSSCALHGSLGKAKHASPT